MRLCLKVNDKTRILHNLDNTQMKAAKKRNEKSRIKSAIWRNKHHVTLQPTRGWIQHGSKTPSFPIRPDSLHSRQITLQARAWTMFPRWKVRQLTAVKSRSIVFDGILTFWATPLFNAFIYPTIVTHADTPWLRVTQTAWRKKKVFLFTFFFE